MDDREMVAPEMESWTLMDDQLCRLVDRLRARGCHRILEVELRLTKAGGFTTRGCFTKLFPVFREKGVMTITNAADEGRVLYSSNRDL